MNNTISINRNVLAFGIPFGLFIVLIYLMKSALLTGNEVLTLGVTADLILTIPLVYFLLIRKTAIPNTTVVPMMVLGLAIGTYFLPRESQFYLVLFKNWALPVIELSVVTLVVVKVRAVLARYKRMKGLSPDFFTTLTNTCKEILPQKLVMPFATEVAVFYYGFVCWRSQKLEENEFAYHKTSGTPALFVAVIFMIVVETLALHILLMNWNQWVAWILSALSVYTAIQILGFAKALARRPIAIDNGRVIMRYGILNEVAIDFQDIEGIEQSRKPIENPEDTKTLSPLGEMEGHNVIIHLNCSNSMTGLYGFKKQFRSLAFYIDEPGQFIKKLEEAMDSESQTRNSK